MLKTTQFDRSYPSEKQREVLNSKFHISLNSRNNVECINLKPPSYIDNTNPSCQLEPKVNLKFILTKSLNGKKLCLGFANNQKSVQYICNLDVMALPLFCHITQSKCLIGLRKFRKNIVLNLVIIYRNPTRISPAKLKPCIRIKNRKREVLGFLNYLFKILQKHMFASPDLLIFTNQKLTKKNLENNKNGFLKSDDLKSKTRFFQNGLI